MGTAGYMSPEQLRGEKLDARTDLFSFGLVLYEMVTGQRPFTGDTAAALHNSIQNDTHAPAHELNPKLPAMLEVIINRALEKDREARYQTASEIRADLDRLKRDMEPKTSARRRREVALAGFAVLFIAGAVFWFAKRQPPSPPFVPDLKLRQLTTNPFDNRVRSGAISPDGKYLAYTDPKGMFIKLIETGETRAVPKPEALKSEDVEWETGPWYPGSTRFLANAHPPGLSWADWSSQGTSIWMVSVLGEAPRKLRDNAVAYSISPDGSLLSFGTNKGRFGEREIWLMQSDGEQAQKLYDTNENSAIFGLTWSPDGQRVMYIRIDESSEALVSRDLKGGAPTTLLPSSELKKLHELLWLPDGRMIYTVDEPGAIGNTCNYWVVRIDVSTGELIEKPRRLTNWSGFCMADMSATADGKRLAFVEWAGHLTSYVADLDAGGKQILRPSRFPSSESSDGTEDWTADSKAIFFISNRAGNFGIYKQALDQDTAEPIVTEGYGRDPRVTPDGKNILFLGPTENGAPPAGGPEPVMRVPITGGPSQRLFSAHMSSLMSCARSPSSLCVIGEPTEDGKQLIVSALDPLKGRGPELFRFALAVNDNNWSLDLSPDGTRVAVTRAPAVPIYILSLGGQVLQQVQVKGYSNLEFVHWAADGKGLFVTANIRDARVILHVDFQGNARVLWKNTGSTGETLAFPSPDGRHLAFQGWTANANMWMMENF